MKKMWNSSICRWGVSKTEEIGGIEINISGKLLRFCYSRNCLRGEVITEKEGEDTIKVQMKIVC